MAVVYTGIDLGTMLEALLSKLEQQSQNQSGSYHISGQASNIDHDTAVAAAKHAAQLLVQSKSLTLTKIPPVQSLEPKYLISLSQKG